MIEVITWLLIAVGGYNSNNLAVIEKFSTQEDCVSTKQEILEDKKLKSSRARISCIPAKNTWKDNEK